MRPRDAWIAQRRFVKRPSAAYVEQTHTDSLPEWPAQCRPQALQPLHNILDCERAEGVRFP